MNPVLIDLNFIQIRWYSILILLGFYLGYLIVIRQSKKLKYPITKIIDLCFYLVIVSIIGARLYYCLFNMDYYKYNLLSIFKIWEGGLAIHGGIILSIIFVLIYYKKIGIKLFEIYDLFVPSLALGQAIGRWGNFFNQEAYGSITSLEFLNKIHIPKFIIDGMYINGNYYHPTFLYESIGCLIIFIILIIIRNNKKIKTGQITSIYFILYGILRYNIESLRLDSLMINNLKVAQLVSILMILSGIIIFIVSLRSKNDK